MDFILVHMTMQFCLVAFLWELGHKNHLIVIAIPCTLLQSKFDLATQTAAMHFQSDSCPVKKINK